MNTRQDYSVDQLRRQSEATRAELAGTVSELRDAVSDTASELKTLVSPSHIKQEIKSYVLESGESLLQSFERKAIDNPLQAAAIGAAIAYPAWSLMRAIPTPLLLIGAGLWLTSSSGRKTMNQVNATVADAVDRGTEHVSEFASTIKDEIAERADAVTNTLLEAGDALASRAGEATQQARMAAHDMRDALAVKSGAAAGRATAAGRELADAGRGLADSTAQTLADAKDSAAHAIADATDGIASAARKSQSAIMEFADKNPLLLAGIGAAVGAFIAASLPPSDVENRMFGSQADDLKDQARDAAARGLDQAKGFAAEVAGDVAAAAAREGLDGRGMQKAVETVSQGLKSVAERGVKTALGDTSLAPEIQPS